MYYVICTYIHGYGSIHLMNLSHSLLLSVNHLFVQLQAFKCLISCELSRSCLAVAFVCNLSLFAFLLTNHLISS